LRGCGGGFGHGGGIKRLLLLAGWRHTNPCERGVRPAASN
jgi:hypothetical protein